MSYAHAATATAFVAAAFVPSPRLPIGAPQPCATPQPVTDRRRPRLLLAAARHGQALYRRDRDLQRLLRTANLRHPQLAALTELEQRHETARRSAAAGYAFARHIEVLIALLAEERLNRA